ncbi:MAG: 30S ribosomal protein S3 [Candidatus Woesearchaeota archaeon]
MIERDFISRNKTEYQIQEFVKENLKGVGLSHVKVQRTPLGEKIVIYASRPGLIIGGGGNNIKKLTKQLKKKFNLENPQIEISEITDVNLIAAVVAERIAIALEKFGTMRFKGIGHKAMADVMNAGARGVEIIISGKIPSARARSWRFYQGYLKKCGQPALDLVDTAYAIAKLKSGIVGIKVSIMPPNVRLPDDVQLKDEQTLVMQEAKTEELDNLADKKTEEKIEEEKPKKQKRSKKE